MTKWLQSGLRRDICIVVADLGNPTGHDVKRAIEAHYEETVRDVSWIDHGTREDPSNPRSMASTTATR